MILRDQNSSKGAPANVTIDELASENGIVISFNNKDDLTIASIVVELHNGRLRLHAWNEADEGKDPTLSMTLIENCGEAFKRSFNEK